MDVSRVGIVGAGTMGQGIATACAGAGLEVLLGDFKYRPCPLLRQMVRAGHLGVKSGRGFFEYDDDGQVNWAEKP